MTRRVGPTRSGRWRTAVTRGAALALLWWILTEGAGGLVFAAVLIPLALAASLVLGPPHAGGVRLVGVARFAPFFLYESMRGGVDVARRALDPRLPLTPALQEFALRLTGPRERVLLANVLSLLPGTVCAQLHAGRVRLHVLDVTLPIEGTVRRVEAHIAAIFGTPLGTLPPARQR